MAAFKEIPSFNLHGASEWILEERLVYVSDLAGAVVCPAGFVTDLASIPRAFRWAFPQNDRHRLAAVVHDFLVRNAYSRKERMLADRVFLEAMTVLNVGWKRWPMFWAVFAVSLVKRNFP